MMDPMELKELDELIQKYIEVTGYPRENIVLVVSPDSEMMKPNYMYGGVPKTVFGVTIHIHKDTPDDVFWLFHYLDVENLDTIIPGILGEVDEDVYIINCVNCGHPINLEIVAEESVPCPWCQIENELGDDE